jgi:hypothetical protein
MDKPRDDRASVGTVVFASGVEIDAALGQAVGLLKRDGLAVAGLLQHFGERQPGGKRSMWLENVASGAMHRIDQPRGPGASGCVLDTSGLVDAAAELRQVADSRADIAVVNRFGKSEAEGQGLRDEIAAIVLAGIPLLIAVRDDLLTAWEAFLGRPTAVLPADPAAIRDWAWTEARARAVPAGNLTASVGPLRRRLLRP